MFWYMQSVLILVTGTMFIMWLGERITDKGIGNGISLIIMIGIIARLPFAFFGEFGIKNGRAGGGLVIFIGRTCCIVVVYIGNVFCLFRVHGKIPVQFAKRIVGNKQYGGVRQYIPLKVNAAGVMPIIFAQAIMFIPLTLAGFSDSEAINRFCKNIFQF